MHPHFSSRTAWPLSPSPIGRAQEAARARFGAGFLDLTDANPTAVGLRHDEDALARALAAPEVFGYSPDPFGLASAREAVAAYYARRGLALEADRIALVASTSEAYSHLFRLLTDPGDAVLVPRPSYPLFTHLADLADVRETAYRLSYDGAWYLDRTSLQSAEAAAARALLVVSPNNPTGSILDADERRFVEEWSWQRGIPIVSDEVFADFLLDDPDASTGYRAASLVGTARGLTFSLNGLSKIAGLPQMKLGWIAISGEPDLRAAARARLEVILDTYLSVSAPAQALLPTALALAEAWQATLRVRLLENRARMDRLLEGSALRRRHAAGGWTALVDLPATETDEAWCLAFLEAGVATHPGYLYDLLDRPAFAVSLIVEPERFEAGLTQILELVERRLAVSL